eukprot:6213952-Pleurochrysis_carterae.AAC.5
MNPVKSYIADSIYDDPISNGGHGGNAQQLLFRPRLFANARLERPGKLASCTVMFVVEHWLQLALAVWDEFRTFINRLARALWCHRCSCASSNGMPSLFWLIWYAYYILAHTWLYTTMLILPMFLGRPETSLKQVQNEKHRLD